MLPSDNHQARLGESSRLEQIEISSQRFLKIKVSTRHKLGGFLIVSLIPNFIFSLMEVKGGVN